jgi:hypothetical protein
MHIILFLQSDALHFHRYLLIKRKVRPPNHLNTLKMVTESSTETMVNIYEILHGVVSEMVLIFALNNVRICFEHI